MWLLFQHDSGLKSESNESFNFIKKFDFRWLWVSVHHSYRIQFSLWPTVQGYFLFFIFSLLFFKLTSINDVVMKWFINLLLPLFYDIFRLIDEISGSQNVELHNTNQAETIYFACWGYKTANLSKFYLSFEQLKEKSNNHNKCYVTFNTNFDIWQPVEMTSFTY